MAPGEATSASCPAISPSDEANDLLPELRPLLAGMRRLRRRADPIRRELEGIAPEHRYNGHSSDASRLMRQRREMRRLGERPNAALEHVQGMGVEVKDVDTGLAGLPELAGGPGGLPVLASGRQGGRLLARPGEQLSGASAAVTAAAARLSIDDLTPALLPMRGARVAEHRLEEFQTGACRGRCWHNGGDQRSAPLRV